MVTGEQAPAMFAKICGVDLRPHKFEQGRIAQTSVAKIGAIVIRDYLGELPAYHLLADSASAEYMWMLRRRCDGRVRRPADRAGPRSSRLAGHG